MYYDKDFSIYLDRWILQQLFMLQIRFVRSLGLKTGDILSLRAYVSQDQGSKKDGERQGRKSSLIEKLLEQKQTPSGGSGTKRK